MDNKIIFKIETDKPLPVEDFTKSLEALNKEYKAFSGVAELHISEIRKGSYEVEFINYIAETSIFAYSVIENYNSIFEFFNHLKRLFASLKKGENVKSPNPKLSLENASDIARPIINNYGGTINLFSGNDNFVINSQEARDINEIVHEVLPQKTIEDNETNKIYKKVLFNWWQVGFNEKNPNSGNKGIIEKISKNPVKVIFQDDDSQTKEKMTTSQNGIDWQKVNYIVDVEAITKGDKIAVYKILQNYMEDSFVDDEEIYFE